VENYSDRLIALVGERGNHLHRVYDTCKGRKAMLRKILSNVEGSALDTFIVSPRLNPLDRKSDKLIQFLDSRRVTRKGNTKWGILNHLDNLGRLEISESQIPG
jgi:hypothetical protein